MTEKIEKTIGGLNLLNELLQIQLEKNYIIVKQEYFKAAELRLKEKDKIEEIKSLINRL